MRVGGELPADALLFDVDERTQKRLHELAELFSVHDLLRAIKLFNQAQLDLRSSDQSQLALELAFVEAALPEAQSTSAPPAAVQDTTLQPASKRPVSAAQMSAARVSVARTAEEKPAVEEATPAPPLARQQPVQRSGRGVSPPPAAPPRTESRVSAPEAEAPPESKSEPTLDVLAPDYLGRMQSEISSALRAEGSLGKNADGLFRSVFVIGDVRILNGNEILLGLPPNVLSRVTGDITQTVGKVIGAVLGKACSVRFVEKGSVSASSAGAHARSAGEQDTDVQSASQLAAPVMNVEESETHVKEAAAEAQDPYQEAVSDPVVQDLVSRGGQVTGVQVLSDE
jgi:hypothetical protein